MKPKTEAVLTTPAYTFAEAAHYPRMPTSTLRSWCLGQSYRDRPEFAAVIRLDGDASDSGLSFLNLVEAHALSAICRVHAIPFPRVRDALQYVAAKLKTERPLADAEFQTNGIDLFVDGLGLLNVSRGGQVEIASMLRAHFTRIGAILPASLSSSIRSLGRMPRKTIQRRLRSILAWLSGAPCWRGAASRQPCSRTASRPATR